MDELVYRVLENLKKENEDLKDELGQLVDKFLLLEKDYNTLFNDWRIDRLDDPNDCYKCVCGMVSECNCYHKGLLIGKEYRRESSTE